MKEAGKLLAHNRRWQFTQYILSTDRMHRSNVHATMLGDYTRLMRTCTLYEKRKWTFILCITVFQIS